MKKKQYYETNSIKSALTLLDEFGSEAMLIAGGTDLVLDIQKQEKNPTHIIGITNIQEISRIEWKDNLYIGATSTFYRLINHDSIIKYYEMLSEATRCIGSKQIRNIATIGGNICNALPCADSIPSLIAADASVEITRLDGSHQMPLDDFIIAPRRTILKANEMVTRLVLPKPLPHTGSAYRIHTTRKALDLTIVGVAAAISVAEDHQTIVQARISLGNCSPAPMRAIEAEQCLMGGVLSEKLLDEAATLAAQSAKVRDSALRASADYRRAMVQVLTKRAIHDAYHRAFPKQTERHQPK